MHEMLIEMRLEPSEDYSATEQSPKGLDAGLIASETEN